jgi:hypothetical protein
MIRMIKRGLLVGVILYVTAVCAHELPLKWDQSWVSVWGRVNQLSDTLVNPQNQLGLAEQYITTRYYVTVEEAVSDGVSVYAVPRFTWDNRDGESLQYMDWDEAYMTVTPHPQVFVDVGKKNTRWGTAYAWNIVNIFDPDNRFVKEFNRFRDGVYAQYFDQSDRSISAIWFTDNGDYALRLNGQWGRTEGDVLYLNRNHQSIVGFDAARPLGDAWLVYMEVLAQQGTTALFPVAASAGRYDWLPTQSAAKTIYTQQVWGIQYTALSGTTIIGEYLYNAVGLSDADYAVFEKGMAAANKALQGWGAGFIGDAADGYRFAQFRRHYGFMRLDNPRILPHIGLALNTYYSISDGGFLLLPVITVAAGPRCQVTTRFFVPIGPADGEFKRFYTAYAAMNLQYFF